MTDNKTTDLSKMSQPEKVLRAVIFNPASILAIPKNIKAIKNAFRAVKKDDSDNSLLKKVDRAIKEEGKNYSWLTFKRGGAVKKYSHGGSVHTGTGHALTYKR
jgi:hypothetical protein